MENDDYEKEKNQVHMQKNNNKDAYYTTKWKKIVDFCIGFFGMPIMFFVFQLLSGSIGYQLVKIGIPAFVVLIVGILPLIMLTGALVHYTKHKKRRYISIGISILIVVSLALIFILFGSYFLSFIYYYR